MSDIEKKIREIEDNGSGLEDNGPELITVIHPEDEMYLYFATHPGKLQNPLGLYFLSGAGMMRGLTVTLSALNIELTNIQSFLEFACGYGRFTRHLIRHLDPGKITGSDLYRDAVDFQKATFGVNGFYSELVPEQLVIEDKYEVIFVASLFSHLPKSVWSKWLKKLYDSLADGGALIFSTHGVSSLPKNCSMPDSGFLFHKQSESKTHSVDDYGSTYTSSEYVHDTVREVTGQPVVLEMAKGLFDYQDVYAVRKPFADGRPVEVAQGAAGLSSAKKVSRNQAFNTVFIHAGLPKTGSTYIQNGLQVLSRSGLLKHVAYPVLSHEKEFSYIGSGNGVNTSELIFGPDVGEFVRKHLEACVQEILNANDSRAKDLLISSEQFFFASPEGFSCLKEILLRHAKSVKLIISVRTLREWTYSVYMQRVKGHGMFSNYDEKWLNEYCGDIFLRCFQNLDRFEVDAITFRYQGAGLLQLFLKLIGEDESLSSRVPEIKVNRSLSVEELDIVKQVNSLFQDETLSRMISEDFVKNWPDIKSANFPAAGEEHFRRFASRFAQELGPLRGAAMSGVKEILFADVDEPPVSDRDHVSHDQHDLAEVALRNVRQLLDPYIRDAASYKVMKQYTKGMEETADFFDPIHYLMMHPDILAAGIDPWVHYQDYGRKEGRKSAFTKKGLK